MKETKFKDTELGKIPQDWTTSPISSLIISMNDGPFGSNLKQEHYTTNREARIIQLGNIGEDGWNDTNVKYTTFEYAKKISKHIVNPGDVVVAKMMPAGRAIICPNSEHCYVQGSDAIKICFNDRIFPKYFIYFTKVDAYTKSIEGNTQGSTRQRVSITKYREIPIAYPSLPEQQRIASALSDADALVAELDALIEKKRAVMAGTMQELLTGKRRLKGYNEKWEEKTLEDLLNYEQPTKYLVASTEYRDAGVPVLTAGKTFILGYTNEIKGVYNAVPVIIFDDFTTDSKLVTFPFKAKSSAMKMLSLKDKRNSLWFIYSLMQTIEFTVGAHKRYWISEYSKVKINVPSFEEQRAIAIILSDIDAEIAELEAKRDKYKEVRQGMMQQLLTGKIRLI